MYMHMHVFTLSSWLGFVMHMYMHMHMLTLSSWFVFVMQLDRSAVPSSHLRQWATQSLSERTCAYGTCA